MKDLLQNGLLDLWEGIYSAEDYDQIPLILEQAATGLLGVPCQLRLGEGPIPGQDSIPVEGDDGRCLARLLLLEAPPPGIQSSQDLLIKMIGWALQRVELLKGARERQQLLRELKVARKILEEALPPQTLAGSGWHMAARLEPALHLGGDLFSYSSGIRMTRFLLVDAVGHGLGSTLLASECRALWRALAREPSLLSEVETLSRMLCEDTGDSRFVAATLGRCHSEGRLEFVACGQGPCFLFQAGRVTSLEQTDPPLGLFESQSFSVQTQVLDVGEMLICATDGLLEWGDEQGRMFGTEGVVQCLQGAPERCPEEIVGRLFESVKSFHRPQSPRDDVCVLALQWCG